MRWGSLDTDHSQSQSLKAKHGTYWTIPVTDFRAWWIRFQFYFCPAAQKHNIEKCDFCSPFAAIKSDLDPGKRIARFKVGTDVKWTTLLMSEPQSNRLYYCVGCLNPFSCRAFCKIFRQGIIPSQEREYTCMLNNWWLSVIYARADNEAEVTCISLSAVSLWQSLTCCWLLEIPLVTQAANQNWDCYNQRQAEADRQSYDDFYKSWH